MVIKATPTASINATAPAGPPSAAACARRARWARRYSTLALPAGVSTTPALAAANPPLRPVFLGSLRDDVMAHITAVPEGPLWRVTDVQ